MYAFGITEGSYISKINAKENKNMKKRVFAMLLAMAMVFSLMACGSKDKAGGSDGDTIRLGGVGPLTGGYANYGLSVQHGAELAAKEINAAGGVNGKMLEVQFQDSQGDPESAVAAYGKLMDWGMNVSLGAVLSGETASVVAAAKADNMFIMETTGSADKCIDGNDKAFRICFYDSYQGTAAADYLKDKALATEVGVFYQSDNDYSAGLYNAFAAQCQKVGVTIKETQTFTTATNTDFSTQVNALVASGVKVVFLPIYAEEASTFLTQAKGKFGSDVYFFGADGLDGILGKVSQDVSIADNVLMMTPFAADSAEPKVQAFVKAYQDAYNATPDQFAADGYDAVYAVKAAIEAAKGSTSGTDLAAVMTSLTVEGVTGTMTWSADGNTNKAASAILYKNGVGTLFGGQKTDSAAE
ncbi:MAG TPA: amino acid ABC transporter substrate-binding protein [Oscillibacter sp.]|nr:amino acid ABC transporter substrate-binding protein [Oscillibacter sp.]